MQCPRTARHHEQIRHLAKGKAWIFIHHLLRANTKTGHAEALHGVQRSRLRAMGLQRGRPAETGHLRLALGSDICPT